MQASKPGSFLGLGTPVLPPLPLHGGDRNRTSPFAFTGNKFEFRALGSNQSPAFPNTVLNTIVAESVDELADKLKTALERLGRDAGEGRHERRQGRLGGQQAGRLRRRRLLRGVAQGGREARPGEPQTTPDALPWLVDKSTVAAFKKYKVLSKRELESRYEVFTEQYAVNINIEAETAATIARTMVLPAAVRYLNELRASGLEELVGEVEPLIKELHFALIKLEDANLDDNQPDSSRAEVGGVHARHGDPGDGRRARRGRPPGEARGRRPVAAAEVPGDAVHQVGSRAGWRCSCLRS